MSSNISDTVTAHLSPEAAQQAVVKARELQSRQTAVGRAGREFVDKIKTSQLFNLKWDDVLVTAPMSIQALGTCIIAANSDTARLIQIGGQEHPLKGFSSSSLNGCLIEVINQGYRAFQSADENMYKISQISSHVAGPKDMSGGLDMQGSLANLMKQIRESSDDCVGAAHAMHQSFDQWLDLVSELHRATQDRESTAQKQVLNANNELKATKAAAEVQAKLQQDASKHVEQLGETLKTTQEAFRKASDSYPSGWEVVGMDLVGGLSRTFLGAANSLLAVATAPIKAVTTPNGQVQVTAKPIEPFDPVYTQIHTYIMPITKTKALVTAKRGTGTPDWDRIVRPKKDEDPLPFLENMNKMASDAFDSSSTSEAGMAYKKVLLDWADVLAGLRTLTEDADNIQWESPDPKSPEVKRLVSKTVSMYRAAIKLNSTANTQAGMPAGQIPSVVNYTHASGGDTTHDSIAEAVLANATNRMNQTQAAYTAATQNYQKSTEALVRVEQDLGKLKGALIKLESDTVTYADIKTILAQSIGVVTQLKDNLKELIRFFVAVLNIVGFCEKTQVRAFLDQLSEQAGPRGGGGGGGGGGTIAGFTFTEFQRELLFVSAINIRAYYMIFSKVAQMYTEVSKESIMPGIEMVNRFSVPGLSDAELAKNRKELQDYSDNAARVIRGEVTRVQDEVQAQLEGMAKTASQELEMLPPAPVEITKAIEEGKKENTDAVGKALEEQQTPIGRINLDFDADD